jgi:hypothetical protein
MDVNTVLIVTYNFRTPPVKYILERFNEPIDAVPKNTVNSKTDECLLNSEY